jgi:hypothetical protein
MKKKIYKNIISFTVLSETPLEDGIGLGYLESIVGSCITGDFIGGNITTESKELSGKRAVEEIQKLDSDPEFFQMDGSGNDISEMDVDDDSPDEEEE